MRRARSSLSLTAGFFALLLALPTHAAETWKTPPRNLAAALEKPDPAYPPQPAFFVLRDQDSVLYLMGSQHRIPKKTKWLTPQVRSAFFESDEIWFEITMEDSAHPIHQINSMREGQADEGQALPQVLTAEEYEKVQTAADKLGVDMNLLDTLKPWAAADVLDGLFQARLEEKENPDANGYSDAKDLKAGAKPKSKMPQMQGGVEDILSLMSIGRPMKSVEDVERHIMLFDRLPIATQRLYLMNTIRELTDISEDFKRLTKSWSTGDLPAIARDEVAKMKRNNPDYYDAMLTRRNIEMTDRIESEMKKSGVDFIVVGAAHLSGEDSVLNMLINRGYRPMRVYDTQSPVATHDPGYKVDLPLFQAQAERLPKLSVTLLPPLTSEPNAARLRLSAPYVTHACGEYLPLLNRTQYDGSLVDVQVSGMALFFAPPRQRENCGTPSKVAYVDIPLDLKKIKENKADTLWLSRRGAMDKFKLSLTDDALTLTPPEDPLQGFSMRNIAPQTVSLKQK